MDPIAFQIGPVAVYWYGILIVLGILAAAYLSTYTAKLWGEDPQLVWDVLVWCVLLGVVGARLYHVVTVPPSMGVDRWYYFRNPLQIFATWKGGLGIYGAVLGGALGIYIVIRRAKRDVWRWLDIVAPGVALAQAVGRWGNFINQELYGLPTELPWGIYIEPRFRLSGYEMYERFHPTFFYESMWNLLTCIVLVYLIWRYRERLIPGIVTGAYFISYSVIRFCSSSFDWIARPLGISPLPRSSPSASSWSPLDSSPGASGPREVGLDLSLTQGLRPSKRPRRQNQRMGNRAARVQSRSQRGLSRKRSLQLQTRKGLRRKGSPQKQTRKGQRKRSSRNNPISAHHKSIRRQGFVCGCFCIGGGIGRPRRGMGRSLRKAGQAFLCGFPGGVDL